MLSRIVDDGRAPPHRQSRQNYGQSEGAHWHQQVVRRMVMQDGAARHARCGRRLGAAAVHSRERRPQGWRGTVGSSAYFASCRIETRVYVLPFEHPHMGEFVDVTPYRKHAF